MNEPFRRNGDIAAKIYAVLVLLCGLVLAFFAFDAYSRSHIGGAALYALVPGLVFVALSVFIWRGAMWAMILVATCTLGIVLFVGALVLLPVPAVFWALTAICIVCRIKGRTA